MKSISKIAAFSALLALLPVANALASSSFNPVVELNFTGAALVQGESSSSSDGTLTTYPKPAKLKIDTKFLLTQLARATGTTSFPVGAKLVAVTGTGNAPVCQVWSKDNTLLADVSSIMSLPSGKSLSMFYGNYVTNGNISDFTHLPRPTYSGQVILAVSYNDTSKGGELRFVVTGLATSINTATIPIPATGVYKETASLSATALAGDGNYRGWALVMTATLKGSASGEGKE